MVEHNNGIALLFNRLDNKIFQNVVFPKAKGILFMKGRIKFHREDGTIGKSPGCGSILVAFGDMFRHLPSPRRGIGPVLRAARPSRGTWSSPVASRAPATSTSETWFGR